MKTPRSSARLVVLIALGFLLGVLTTIAVYWLDILPERGDRTTDIDTSALQAEDGSEVPPTVSPSELTSTTESPVIAILSLDDLAGIKSAFARDLALRHYLAKLSENQIDELFTHFHDHTPDASMSGLPSAITERLASLNPKLALTRVLALDPQSHHEDFVASIFREWSHSNLEEAVSNAAALDENFRQAAAYSIVHERKDLSDEKLQSIARRLGNEQVAATTIALRRIRESIGLPELAWTNLIADLQGDSTHVQDISRVALAWVEKSGPSVLNEVNESLTNTETRLQVLMYVLKAVAKTNPSGAFQFAATLENDPYNMIMEGVAETWARSDPRAALAAASQIEDVSLRSATEDFVVSSWAQESPQDVLEGIDGLPANLRETAIMVALVTLANETPEEAAKLVASLESSSIKFQAAQGIVIRWVHRDHRATVDWLLNEPGIEEHRLQLLHVISGWLVQEDPQFAFTVARAQPFAENESNRPVFGEYGLEAHVVGYLADTDVEGAIELLAQVRPGVTKVLSYQYVAGSLVDAGEIDRAFALFQKVPESERIQLQRAWVSAWARNDPEGLLDSMDRFASRQVKSKAAMGIVAANSFLKTMSDERIEEAKKYLVEEDAKALEEGGSQLLLDLYSGM